MKINHLWRGSVIVTMMMMSSKSVEWLQEELETGASSLLLLDCRPHELYESSHIESAINLAIPGLMLRRLKKGNLPIRSIIPNNEDKEKFVKRCKTDVVVLYDEATSERQENGLGSSVLGLLLQKLRDDGCKAYYLEGKIQTEHSAGKHGPACFGVSLSIQNALIHKIELYALIHNESCIGALTLSHSIMIVSLITII